MTTRNLLQQLDIFDDELHFYRDDEDLMDDENLNFNEYASKIEYEEEHLLIHLTRRADPTATISTIPAAVPGTADPSATISKDLKPGEEISEQAARQAPPRYLTVLENGFDRKMTDVILNTGARLTVDEVRPYAVLLHRSRITELNLKLWKAYSQSGTGVLLEGDEKERVTRSNRPLKLWPEAVKTTMIEYQRTARPLELIDDTTCFNYVYQVLRRLQDRIIRYEVELDEECDRLRGRMTEPIKEIIRRFVDEIGTFRYRSEVDAKLISIKYDYYDRLLEFEFQDQHPQPRQLELFHALNKLKYEKEKFLYEIRTMKHRLTYNQPPKSYDSLQLPIPLDITTITSPFLNQQLTDRCEKIFQRAKSDMLMVHITSLEYTLKEKTRQLDQHLSTMNGIPFAPYLGASSRFNPSMIDIVQRQFVYIEERLRQLHALKKRFFSKAPTARIQM